MLQHYLYLESSSTSKNKVKINVYFQLKKTVSNMKIFIKIIDRRTKKNTQTLCRDFVERSAKIT